MNLRRLASMPLPVLLDRVRQEIVRGIDRRLVSSRQVIPDRLKPRRLAPERYRSGRLPLHGGEVTHDHLGAVRGRFFAGALEAVNAASVPGARALMAEEIRDSARACCAGHFDLLGYEKLFYGRPVDWHYDPVSGRRSPRVHWSLIDPLDAAAVGDSKVIWELNRHQWLVRLGQAYRLDGDERHARFFAATLRDWMQHNPPGIGINWASSLELALRLIAWSWALVLFRDAAALTPELRDTIHAWVGAQAAHVDSYLSHSFSPNTHLTGEALGLYYVGTLFPELDAGGRWRRHGREILLRELTEQVHEDGVYFEQSTCYQRYTVEIYLHFILLARINDEALPPFVTERVQGLVDWLLAVQHPDGSMPRIGDEDGGWLLPLALRKGNDARGVFALAAAVFRRADYAWAARGESAEVFWLMGRNGVRALEGLAPRPPRGPLSRQFPRGGYTVMRSSWRRDAHQLIFDAGPLGCPHSAGHGHADLLSIQCAAFGRPVLVDAGTYCYTPEPSWRSYLRGTFAHNTVIVDGAGQSEPVAAFRWKDRPAARMAVWNSAPAVDYADACHDAYARLPGAVRHRRRVLFVKPDYWVVVDDFTGGGIHEFQLRYQFAPLSDWRRLGEWSLGLLADGPGLMVRAFAPVALTAKVYSGSLDPVAGWISEAYGALRAAPLLNYRAISELPLRIVSLLVPVKGDRVRPFPAEVEFREDDVCHVLAHGRDIVITRDTASIERVRESAVAGGACAASEEDTPCAR